MLALRDVVLDLGDELGGYGAVEEVGKFGEKVCAGHAGWPSFFWALKYRLSRSRN